MFICESTEYTKFRYEKSKYHASESANPEKSSKCETSPNFMSIGQEIRYIRLFQEFSSYLTGFSPLTAGNITNGNPNRCFYNNRCRPFCIESRVLERSPRVDRRCFKRHWSCGREHNHSIWCSERSQCEVIGSAEEIGIESRRTRTHLSCTTLGHQSAGARRPNDC